VTAAVANRGTVIATDKTVAVPSPLLRRPGSTSKINLFIYNRHDHIKSSSLLAPVPLANIESSDVCGTCPGLAPDIWQSYILTIRRHSHITASKSKKSLALFNYFFALPTK